MSSGVCTSGLWFHKQWHGCRVTWQSTCISWKPNFWMEFSCYLIWSPQSLAHCSSHCLDSSVYCPNKLWRCFSRTNHLLKEIWTNASILVVVECAQPGTGTRCLPRNQPWSDCTESWMEWKILLSPFWIWEIPFQPSSLWLGGCTVEHWCCEVVGAAVVFV